jgi:hypothetical protein
MFRQKTFRQNQKIDFLSNNVLSKDVLSKIIFVKIPVHQMAVRLIILSSKNYYVDLCIYLAISMPLVLTYFYQACGQMGPPAPPNPTGNPNFNLKKRSW